MVKPTWLDIGEEPQGSAADPLTQGCMRMNSGLHLHSRALARFQAEFDLTLARALPCLDG